jgi:hypothetical protein
LLLAQIPPPPGGSIDPFIGWLLALVLGGFTAALGVMWRQAVAESNRKDELIDRLLNQVGRAAEATDRSVSLAEKRDRERRDLR